MRKNTNGAGKKKKNYSFSFLNRFMIIQFLLMVILAFFIAKAISTRSVDNAKQHLSAVTDERAQIVIDHVETTETLLEALQSLQALSSS